MQSISRWSVLNDAVRVVHPENLPLRDLDDDNPIYKELKSKYLTDSKDFLRFNSEDNVKILNAFQSFIQFQMNSFLTSQMLLNLTPEGWKEAIEIYFHFRHQMSYQSPD